MDFIRYATMTVRNTIPFEILDLTFSANNQFHKLTSIDALIEKNIIKGRMSTDLNLIRGVEIIIPIANTITKYQAEDGILLEIPADLLQGRKLISVLSVVSYRYEIENNTSSITESIQTMYTNTVGNYTGVQVADIDIVSDNEIFINTNDIIPQDLALRCVVEYSSRFAELNPRSYPNLVPFITSAAKSYIYNRMIIKVNRGELYNGVQLDIIKDIIDSYSDAEEKYQDELHMAVAKILFMNDNEAMSRYTKRMIPNRF